MTVGSLARVRHLPELLARLTHLGEGRRRFVRREVAPNRVEAEYGLRRSGVRFRLRHHTADGTAFNDVFLRRLYEPPPAVLEVLEAQSRPLRVLDLGAHVGLFGVYMLHRFGDVKITAFEPVPANAAVLRRCVAANDLPDGRWVVREAYAATHDGWVELDVSGDEISAHLADRPSARTIRVAAQDVLQLLPLVGLLKMDIEGAEWPILRDPRFAAARVPAIVLEYHPRGSDCADARSEATRQLTIAGYAVADGGDQGGGMGMLWACRSGA